MPTLWSKACLKLILQHFNELWTTWNLPYLSILIYLFYKFCRNKPTARNILFTFHLASSAIVTVMWGWIYIYILLWKVRCIFNILLWKVCCIVNILLWRVCCIVKNFLWKLFCIVNIFYEECVVLSISCYENCVVLSISCYENIVLSISCYEKCVVFSLSCYEKCAVLSIMRSISEQ